MILEKRKIIKLKKDAIKIIKKARKLGINSFDTASNYGDSKKNIR